MEHSELTRSEELYELEPELVVDISDQAFEDLSASLKKIEAMKQEIAEGILKAKKKNLTAHVEKFRAILRELVVMENALLEEKSKKETAKLALELDRLEAECSKELSANAATEAAEEIRSEHSLKATRYGIAARLIGFGGVFAFLLGCIVYLVLVQVDAVHVTFNWIWPIANAALAVLFAAIGLSLNKKSLSYAALAQADAERLAAEKEKAADKLAAEYSGIALQAYAVELAKEMQENAPAADELPKEKAPFFSVKKVGSGSAEEVQISVNASPLMLFAATFAGAAALATVLLVGKSSHGGKKEKRRSAPASKKSTPKLQGIFLHLDD